MYFGLEPLGLRFDAVALGSEHPLGLLAYSLLAIGKALVSGFLLSALLHRIYDFLVLLSPVSALPIAAALIVTIWIWRLILMRRPHRDAVDKSPGN
jgi:hypothetical protein